MRIGLMLGCLPLAAALGGCWSGIYENPAAEYVNRSDTVTLSAGNAKNANEAIHIIDPWPRYVGNRRIPGDGERMAGAVSRYHKPAIRGQGGQGQGGAGLTPAGSGGGAGGASDTGGSGGSGGGTGGAGVTSR